MPVFEILSNEIKSDGPGTKSDHAAYGLLHCPNGIVAVDPHSEGQGIGGFANDLRTRHQESKGTLGGLRFKISRWITQLVPRWLQDLTIASGAGNGILMD